MAAPRAITAAASRYTSRKIRGRGAGDQSWQGSAYDVYHAVPGVRFAASWIGNAMSGARLIAARRADDGTTEQAPDNHRSAEVVAQIAGGPDGQSKLLGAFGRHLTIPGEGWIVVPPNSEVLSPDSPEDGHDWRVVSVKEVKQQSGKLMAEIDGEDVPIPEGDPETLDPGAPVAIRVWEPDPERAIEADSPVRSSLELLEELLLLNAAVKAIARPRITGRGLLLIPKGTRFPTSGTQGGAEDDLIETFMAIAETAVRDPESAAAIIPIVLEVPADTIADFKLVKFESEFLNASEPRPPCAPPCRVGSVTVPDRNGQLDQAEREFTDAVAAALTATADEVADAVIAATELVTARLSVGRIARMWGARTRGLVRRLLGTAEEAATAAAEDIGEDLPDGWDDLPGRYDDTVPEGLGQYA
ncbi:hypothetical protein AB0L33_33730 [Streptomyces sp. NPDC052299]|uniref:hypothetical protein n=1 Tax=Streptomyces sp. NPDC052299 TaxID=3155054 RepID=UPI0034228B97